MSKVDAQSVCDELNKLLKFDGFAELVRIKSPVSVEMANDSDVACSIPKSGLGFETSALGILNAITNETICLSIVEGDKFEFMTVKSCNEYADKLWCDYEKSIIDFNLNNGTNHKPSERPRSFDMTGKI